MNSIQYDVIKHPLADDDLSWYVGTNLSGLWEFLQDPHSFAHLIAKASLCPNYFVTFKRFPSEGGTLPDNVDILISGIDRTGYLTVYANIASVTSHLGAYLQSEGATLTSLNSADVVAALLSNSFESDVTIDVIPKFQVAATHVQLKNEPDAIARAVMAAFLDASTFSEVMLSRTQTVRKVESSNRATLSIRLRTIKLQGSASAQVVLQGRSHPPGTPPPGPGCVPCKYSIQPFESDDDDLVGTLGDVNGKPYQPC